MVNKCTIEEYQNGALINNGKTEKDFDFIYVLRGCMTFKLDSCSLDGENCSTKSTFITFHKNEYADGKTITDKWLKNLKDPQITTQIRCMDFVK